MRTESETSLVAESEDALEMYERLMQESEAVGNHGRRVNRTDSDSEGLYLDGRRPSHSLDSYSHEAIQALSGNGTAIAPGDESYYGMVAHRGILTSEEFELVDWDQVAREAAAVLGASDTEIAAAYGAGRPDASRIALRDRIDAELLRIQELGGNMHQLAVVLCWPIETTPTGVRCRKMAKALVRAREARLNVAAD